MEKKPVSQKENPAINLFNRQRKVKLEPVFLKVFLEKLSTRLQLEKGFSVVVVSDSRMRDFNRKYAGKDYPTDVLSFPCSDDPGMDEGYLGDIIISAERASSQALNGLESELKILALHGLLHLMGYDHETDKGRMKRLENQIRRDLGL